MRNLYRFVETMDFAAIMPGATPTSAQQGRADAARNDDARNNSGRAEASRDPSFADFLPEETPERATAEGALASGEVQQPAAQTRTPIVSTSLSLSERPGEAAAGLFAAPAEAMDASLPLSADVSGDVSGLAPDLAAPLADPLSSLSPQDGASMRPAHTASPVSKAALASIAALAPVAARSAYAPTSLATAPAVTGTEAEVQPVIAADAVSGTVTPDATATNATPPDATPPSATAPDAVMHAPATSSRVGAEAPRVASPLLPAPATGMSAAAPTTDDAAVAHQPSNTSTPSVAPSGASASAPTSEGQGGASSAGLQAAPRADGLKSDLPAPAQPAPATPTTSLPNAGPAAAAAPSAAAHHAPPVTIQVAMRFIERFDGRAQRFEISLTPEDLGRVDVRIEVGSDKKVHAILAAHDSAALSDLMRGQRALERALIDAGVDLADGGIDFELSDNSQGRSSRDESGARDPLSEPDVWRRFSDVAVKVDADTKTPVRSWRPMRLDLMA